MADKIKEVLDTIKTMTVLELNDLRKAIEEEFGVTAAAPVAVAAAPAAQGGAAAADEGPSTVSVFIKSPGEKKIEVIKVIRNITGLSLTDAKNMAENGGAKAVKENIEKTEADKIVAELTAAGAVVEVK